MYSNFAGGEAQGLYDREDAALILERAENNYDGVSRDALDPVIMRIMELN